MAKKRVYVESTIPSYLTANPPVNDIVKLAKQQLTKKWWKQRGRWDLFISPVVLEEISEGDSEAAEKRIEALRGLPVLEEHPAARALAEKLNAEAPIPEKARADAAHLAFAAFYKMDYLLTWNQTHLGNPVLAEKAYKIIREKGLSPAVILTPEVLMEMKDV